MFSTLDTKAVKTAPTSYPVDKDIKLTAVNDFSLQQYQEEAKVILAHRDLMRFVTTGARTPSEAEQELNNCKKHWRQHGFGNYFVVDQSHNNLVGFGKLYKCDRTFYPNLGYLVNYPYQGRGLGTQIAQSILEIGFEYLNQPKLFAFARINNHPSRRILEKLGFKCLTDRYFEGDRQYAQYVITAERYQPIKYN